MRPYTPSSASEAADTHPSPADERTDTTTRAELRQHFVRLYTSMPIALPGPVRIRTPEIQVTLFLTAPAGAPPEIAHLSPLVVVDCLVDALSPLHAMISALRLASFAIVTTALAHGAGTLEIVPFFGIEVPRGRESVRFLQRWRRLPLSRPPSIAFQADRLNRLLRAMEAIAVDDRASVAHAMMLGQQSRLETDARDAFSDSWEALESLNGIIQRKFSLPRSTTARCSNCGAEREVEVSSGIRYAIESLAGHASGEFDRLRKLRARIAHGSPSREAIDVSNADCKLLNVAVYHAFASIAGLSRDDAEQLARGGAGSIGAVLELNATLTQDEYGSFDGSGSPPHFQLVDLGEEKHASGAQILSPKLKPVGFARTPTQFVVSTLQNISDEEVARFRATRSPFELGKS